MLTFHIVWTSIISRLQKWRFHCPLICLCGLPAPCLTESIGLALTKYISTRRIHNVKVPFWTSLALPGLHNCSQTCSPQTIGTQGEVWKFEVGKANHCVITAAKREPLAKCYPLTVVSVALRADWEWNCWQWLNSPPRPCDLARQPLSSIATH